MNVDKLLFLAVLVLTGCRLVMVMQGEITPDEALLWKQSKHPAAGYVENGPVIPWLLHLGTSVFGETAFGLRVWNPLFTALATALVYLLARSTANQAVARWMVVLFSLTPYPNLAGLAPVSESAALVSGLGAMWCFWCALHRAHRWHWLWPVTGALLALAVLTSPPLAYLGLAMVCTPLAIPRWRRLWRRPGPYLLLGTALTIFCIVWTHPTSTWHAVNVWELRFRRWHGAWGWHGGSAAFWFLNLAGLTGPLVVAGFLWMLTRRFPGAWRDAGTAFSTWFGVVLIGGGLALAAGFQQAPFSLWLGIVPFMILLVQRWMHAELSIEWKAQWRAAALVVNALLSLALINGAWIRPLGAYWPRHLHFSPSLGWRESAASLEATLRQAAEADADHSLPFVIADAPRTAAILDFYLADDAPLFRPHSNSPRVHAIESQGLGHSYAQWPNYTEPLAEPGKTEKAPAKGFHGRTALYITTSADTAPPPNVVHAFHAIEPAAILHTMRRQRIIRTWVYFYCYDYRGLPL